MITLGLVGEFWKLGTDQDLFHHFRRYHTAESPALARVHRTTFARQAARRSGRLKLARGVSQAGRGRRAA